MPISPSKPKKKRGPGKPFQKGQVANPGGSNKLQKELAGLKRYSYRELVEHGSALLYGQFKDLAGHADNDEAPAAKTMLARHLYQAHVDGNTSAFCSILDRIVGKPKEVASIELTGKDGGPLQSASTLTTMTVAEMQAELAAIRARREAAK